MIFPGDYNWSAVRHRDLFNYRYLLGELIAGIKSGIPLCCVIYYLIVFRLHVLFKSVKVLNLLYPAEAYEFFQKYQYYRCPICFIFKRTSEVKWNGVREWNYYCKKHKR